MRNDARSLGDLQPKGSGSRAADTASGGDGATKQTKAD